MRVGGNWWTSVLAGGGLLASFGAAACCALPLALASAGLGTAWLAGISPMVAPYRMPLLVAAGVLLLCGALRLGWQYRRAQTCPADAACGSATYRGLAAIALVMGAILFAGAVTHG